MTVEAGILGQIELRSEGQEQVGAYMGQLKLLEGQKCWWGRAVDTQLLLVCDSGNAMLCLKGILWLSQVYQHNFV